MLLQLFGIFAGVLARAFLPWIRKLRQGKLEEFDRKYLYSALGSLLLGIIVTLLIFPKFDPSSVIYTRGLGCFSVAFGFGFGWQSLVNEGGKWSGAF